jgi:hypothetical protein
MIEDGVFVLDGNGVMLAGCVVTGSVSEIAGVVERPFAQATTVMSIKNNIS